MVVGMIVLCTGCRSGFGKLVVERASREGHTVYAGLRDPETAGALGAAGGRVIPVALDMTSEEQREAVVARILREQGRLDALVNNAGVALAGFQEQVATDELRKLFEVNVFSIHALTRLCLPHLRSSRGVVINVSSMAGRQPLPGLGAYASSKFALEGMTEALRLEMRPFGVRVALVEPGPYRTDILSRNRWQARACAEPGPYTALQGRIEKLVERLEHRMGDADEVAALIVRLLTDPSPRLRHALGPGVKARLALRGALPFEAYGRVMARVFGLG